MSVPTPKGHNLPFRRAAVLGAGTMGAQIAAHLANAGLEVDLMDMAPDEGDPNDIVADGFGKATKMSPDPFFSDAAAERIRLGNFRDDMERLAEADWVIEAIVERLDIKRSMMERVEAAIGPHTIISTNTSGIPIGEIAEGRSDSFRRRFLGTHFFNPPRYLELLEVIPSDDTDEDVLARIASFARVHLGKGVVVAKDSPYFIGNRIGVFGLLLAMREREEHGFTIEEIDELTGTLVGHPKSATYRTADLVGLDVLQDVIENLHEKVPGDESRDIFRMPDMMEQLIEAGRLGQKSGAGFYRKVDGDILSWNPDAGEYTEPESEDPGDVDDIRDEGDLVRRLRMLLDADIRSGGFFRRTTLGLMAYAARRIPEITESPAEVDRAIRWGFNWEMGPFEMWDAMGFERVYDVMQEDGYDLPDWIHDLHANGEPSFYDHGGDLARVWSPADGQFVARPRPSDERTFDPERQDPIWENEESALFRLDDDVVLFEFRSKANTLGQRVLAGLRECIDRVENDRDLRGMVVANHGKNFSVGANLKEMGKALLTGQFDQIGASIDAFQKTMQAVRTAGKPVVVAVHQRVLGGATEMVMSCPHPVAAAESYIGLVELGVGLIPAGTGCMRLAAAADAAAPNGHPSEIQNALGIRFRNVAMAEVARSAVQAVDMGYLAPSAPIVMRADRRIHVAALEVIRLSEQGYIPPVDPKEIHVLGRPGAAAFEAMAYQFREGGFVSEYDFKLTKVLAHVMTGGDLPGDTHVSPELLLELEKEAFLHLLGEHKTQQRLKHLMDTGKPLRN